MTAEDCNYFDEKVAPKREERLGACIEYGGCGQTLQDKFRSGCFRNNERGFCQGSICQLLPGGGIVNSFQDSVVIMHGSIGCGGAGHNNNANIRNRQMLAGDQNPRGALWLSTNLKERDVVSGGEEKLEEAILAADRRYRPSVITVVSTCVPGIIGDDIDGVVARLQPEVNAILVPVHCEGFKTKIMATAYDAIYHGLARHVLPANRRRPAGEDYEPDRLVIDEVTKFAEKQHLRRTINLMNVSSMTPQDEAELRRLLQVLNLEVNIYPCFAHPLDIVKATQAALSVSTCPTHDDYFVKHLQAKYGVPYILKHMPVGINNTSLWLRDIADFFGEREKADRFIERETAELEKALAPLRANLAGKKAMLSAGEVRTLATAVWLKELGLEITAVRPYHYDEFGEVDLQKLVADGDTVTVNVATVHPFESVHLLTNNPPDIYLGHNSDTIWAAKQGISILPIYGGANTYVGYQGAFDIARRVNMALKNTSFNRNLSGHVRQPYNNDWFQAEPFAYIREDI
ncbi:oxidoreductase nitrogenase component 1 [Deltaproteobacteria bacterium]|nr:oxidoreductase nitrogenase component 1 [Deltaproteobacteria bacterium]